MPEFINPPWFAPAIQAFKEKSATVIGAGLAGVSTACHLQELGWQVTLIDKHSQFASGTSGNAAGLIKPQNNANNPAVSLYYEKYFEYFMFYLEKLLASDPDIRHGIDCRFGSFGHSSLPPGTKTSAWVSPRDFCRAQLAQYPSIKTRYNCDVSTLKNDSDGWQCIDSDGKLLSETPVCVLAAGFEINFLLNKPLLSIDPLAGQISLLSASAISPPITQACYASHYLIPLNDNNYICGASHHRTESLALNGQDHEANLSGLEQLLPKHSIDKTKVIGGRTGVRAVSPDHLPIIGSVFDDNYYRNEYESLHHGKKASNYAPAKYKNGLFVLGALGSHGIGSSPYLGKLLSELIDGKKHHSDQQTLQLLHPARFLIRELKRKPNDRKLTQ